MERTTHMTQGCASSQEDGQVELSNWTRDKIVTSAQVGKAVRKARMHGTPDDT